MEKLFTIFLAFMLLLTACNKAPPSSSQPPDTTVPIQTQATPATVQTTASARQTTKATTATTAPDDTEEIKLAASYLFDALKAYDYDVTEQFLQPLNDLPESGFTSQKLTRAICSRMIYKLGDCNVNGSNATLKVLITTVDMPTVMDAYLLQAATMEYENNLKPEGERLTPEQLDHAAMELLQSKAEKGVVAPVELEISFYKQDSEWRAHPSDMLADAALGGLLTVARGVTQPQAAQTGMQP